MPDEPAVGETREGETMKWLARNKAESILRTAIADLEEIADGPQNGQPYQACERMEKVLDDLGLSDLSVAFRIAIEKSRFITDTGIDWDMDEQA